MVDFHAMGQPPERRLAGLPMWAREWIQTLKYRVIYWESRIQGRPWNPSGRRITTEPPAAEIFGLPWWAQDWIDLLQAEAKDKKERFCVEHYASKRRASRSS